MRTRTPQCVAVIAPLLIIADALPASAQENARNWEVNVFGGIMDDRPNFSVEDGSFEIAHEGVLGFRIGYHLSPAFFLEGGLTYAPMELAFDRETGRSHHELRATFLSSRLGYNFLTLQRLQFFVRAGLGGVRWNGLDSDEVDFASYLGGGGRLFIDPRIAVRADAGWHYLPFALGTVRRELRPDLGTTGEPLWLPELGAGLSVFFGGSS